MYFFRVGQISGTCFYHIRPSRWTDWVSNVQTFTLVQLQVLGWSQVYLKCFQPAHFSFKIAD